MAYYTNNSRGLSVDDQDLIRQGAPTLQTTDTGLITPSAGDDTEEWWKISNPIAGNTIAVLPDVSLLEPGGAGGIIQATISFGAVTLYQAHVNSVAGLPSRTTLEPIATSSTQSDPILDAQHPGLTPNDTWQKLVVPQGNSGKGWLNEFYLSVGGTSVPIDTVYGQRGYKIPNEGRFLVTTGQITGARDAAWGNWQDVVGAPSTGTPPTGGGPGASGEPPTSDPGILGPINLDLSGDPGDSTKVDSPAGRGRDNQSVTYDPATDTFAIKGASGATVAAMNASYQAALGKGQSKADAYYTALNAVAGDFFVNTGLVVVQAHGSEVPAAVAAGASQVATSVSLGEAMRTFYSSNVQVLEDELKAFDGKGPPIDIDKRVHDNTSKFIEDAGAALAGPTGTVLEGAANKVRSFANAISYRMGNSQPELDATLKTGDDPSLVLLSPGHSDKFFGTDYADKVSINANSIAYGAAGNDYLQGNPGGNDILAGGDGDDTLVATGGTNYLVGGAGNNVLNGGAGFDTAVYDASMSTALVHPNADGSYSVAVAGESDVLRGIESLQFSDGTVDLTGAPIVLPSPIAFDRQASFVNGVTPVLTGTLADPSSQVEVFDGDPANGGIDLGAASIDGNTWSFQASLGQGDFSSLTAVATDGSGRSATAVSPYELVTGVTGKPYRAVEYDYAADGNYGYVEYGSNGAALVVGAYNGDGTHTIYATAGGQSLLSLGSDVMTGGGQRERFVFKPGTGHEEVTDFAAAGRGHDVLDLSNTGFTSMAQVMQNTTMSLGSAVVHLNSQDSITLDGVTKGQLEAHKADFALA